MESTKILEVAGGDQWPDQKRDIKNKGAIISSLDDLKMIFHNILYPKDNKAVDQAFQQLEQKTHLEREKIAYAVIALAGLYMVFGAFARLVCNFIGFAYPAYASVKAIRTAQKDDDTHWLIYWTVFSAFSLIDFFAELILCYFPVYWIIKALFMLYLYLPQTYGAIVLYNRFLDPAITKVDALLKQYMTEKKE
ncbi:TB2/DP1 HVA22 family protein [Brugia pahangi]